MFRLSIDTSGSYRPVSRLQPPSAVRTCAADLLDEPVQFGGTLAEPDKHLLFNCIMLGAQACLGCPAILPVAIA